MQSEVQFGRLGTAGLLLGAGMGGWLEQILLRQVMGANMLLSTKIPLKSGAAFRQSLLWDGFLSALLWMTILLGVIALFQAAREEKTTWSAQAFASAWLAGMGAYLVVEGLVSHHLFQLHHVLEGARPSTQEVADWAYLGIGAAAVLVGWWGLASTKGELSEALYRSRRSVERQREAAGDRKFYLD